MFIALVGICHSFNIQLNDFYQHGPFFYVIDNLSLRNLFYLKLLQHVFTNKLSS